MSKKIEDYEYEKKKLNNQDIGLVNARDDSNNRIKVYQFVPHLNEMRLRKDLSPSRSSDIRGSLCAFGFSREDERYLLYIYEI